MWAIYHQWACLFSPHWAIGVGWLSRILIEGSTLHTPQPPNPLAWRQGDKTGKSNSQPTPSPPPFFPFSRHHFTSAQHAMSKRRRNTCVMARKAHTHTHAHTHQLLDKWVKRGESVTHAAGLGVDYRTPEEIFLSPQTDSGRGLTTAKPQDKHLHISCNTLHYVKRWKRGADQKIDGELAVCIYQSVRMSESFCRRCAI